MKVSLIMTVRNEGESIRPLMASLARQTRQPDEIIICDGGSTDGTVALLKSLQGQLPMRLIFAPGSNISQGRNRAIEEAAGPIIVATDAGVVLSPSWLAELARPFEEEQAKIVSGWFEADPRTDFELAMAATVLPSLADIDPDKFLPSSRSVAYLKSAWETVGGYPEWLDYGEDLVFDLALRQQYGAFAFAPKAVAYYRPRGNLTSFARQYYHYARGDGKANLWPKRHAVRYLTYLVALPFLTLQTMLRRPLGPILLVTGGLVYCRRPIQRLWPSVRDRSIFTRLYTLSLIPLIRLIGDLAKMIGYPVGLLWRWRVSK